MSFVLSVIFFLKTFFIFSCVYCLSRVPDLGSSAIVEALYFSGFPELGHPWPISPDEIGLGFHQGLKLLVLGFCPPPFYCRGKFEAVEGSDSCPLRDNK